MRLLTFSHQTVFYNIFFQGRRRQAATPDCGVLVHNHQHDAGHRGGELHPALLRGLPARRGGVGRAHLEGTWGIFRGLSSLISYLFSAAASE